VRLNLLLIEHRPELRGPSVGIADLEGCPVAHSLKGMAQKLPGYVCLLLFQLYDVTMYD
jgi:hypothetical protein